jgi:hypothetical protein
MTCFKCKSALIRQYITYFKVRLYSRKRRSFKLEGFKLDIAMKRTGSGSLNYGSLLIFLSIEAELFGTASNSHIGSLYRHPPLPN